MAKSEMTSARSCAWCGDAVEPEENGFGGWWVECVCGISGPVSSSRDDAVRAWHFLCDAVMALAVREWKKSNQEGGE